MDAQKLRVLLVLFQKKNQTFKVMWFPPVSAGAFFGEWIFWESRLRWVHVLVIAKYCDYGFKRSGILHRDRPKKTQSTICFTFLLMFLYAAPEFGFPWKNVSNTVHAKNWAVVKHRRPFHLCQSHGVTWLVILWKRTTNLRTVKRMGPFNLLGENPLNISTILRTSPWIRFFLSSLQF